jgi:tetratricopeptide (TPR) repeat protein
MLNTRFRWGLPILLAAVATAVPAAAQPAPITIDYPADKSIFPPEITPPTFLWRDPADGATLWLIDVAFADGSTAIHVKSKGERMTIGEIDPRCVAPTNQPPALTPQQAAAHIWTPDAATWAEIKRHSVERAATVAITGVREADPGRALSRGRVTIETSKDPVGAPIFYRDVPLMPSEVEKGVIKPLAPAAIPLIAWRLRNIGEPGSRLMMEGLHTCANCHSFSRDGKTLGMDMDGPQNDKGMYALVPISRDMSIRNQDVIEWTSFRGKLGGKVRVGFMSQVSPDGQYVVTMINGSEAGRQSAVAASASGANSKPKLDKDLEGNYYVANFKSYGFLQVFFPTRGILAWYSRETGRLEPLPGADDPRYVQTNAVWSPDGKYLVFARAEAKPPYSDDGRLAEFANDPKETQIRYELYRIPFNGGKGGRAEPIRGASGNGMSNTFPKVSPDGRWIVFVQARNGLLMRPDSRLFLVPAQGGKARLMQCNTPLMNSWHSFSPNGRWLVFSSKSWSPYTRMFLTHLDREGRDSPPILIDNTTAANRAVNIPEFLNIAADGLAKIDTPATDFYRLSDNAWELSKAGRYEEAVTEWKKALELSPENDKAHNNVGLLLVGIGRFEEAIPHFEKTLKVNPEYPAAHSNLGVALAGTGKLEEAIAEFVNALAVEPDSAEAHNNLGRVLVRKGNLDEAITHFQKALELVPGSASVRHSLAQALTAKGSLDEAIAQFQKVLEISPEYPQIHQSLGRVLTLKGRFDEAIVHFQKSLEATPDSAEVHNGLGVALVQKGRLDEAIIHFEKAVAANPEFAEAYFNLGDALYYLEHKVPEALAAWRAVLRIDPNHVPVLNQTAWVLATWPEASLRDGSQAVVLAERAVRLSGGREPAILDTLAAAYAEAGRFTEAVDVTKQTLALAGRQNNRRLVEALEARIALYQAKTPFRDTR